MENGKCIRRPNPCKDGKTRCKPGCPNWVAAIATPRPRIKASKSTVTGEAITKFEKNLKKAIKAFKKKSEDK